MEQVRQPIKREVYLNDPDPLTQAMALPRGQTCHDCQHCARCVAMFGHIPEDEVCDWYPSRFAPARRSG